jgi:hypothetical protein
MEITNLSFCLMNANVKLSLLLAQLGGVKFLFGPKVYSQISVLQAYIYF